MTLLLQIITCLRPYSHPYRHPYDHPYKITEDDVLGAQEEYFKPETKKIVEPKIAEKKNRGILKKRDQIIVVIYLEI